MVAGVNQEDRKREMMDGFILEAFNAWYAMEEEKQFSF